MIAVIIIYLLAWLAIATAEIVASYLHMLPPAIESIRIALGCCAVAAIGGSLYCIRAVYLNKAVHKRWDADWHIWYFLRPLASCICGGASFLFLKAGLLVLESNTQVGASEVGFYALAFVAGLNVDRFVAKIETVAQAVWGIEMSRSAKKADDSDN